MYDRLSPATAKYLEGLTAIHDASFFNGIAERLGYPLREGVRGSELNQGKALQARHPVIRTNRKSSKIHMESPASVRVTELSNSCNRLEERLCEQSIHQTYC